MDAFDRHELVLLSSAFGLPALPRVSASDTLDGSQTRPPTDYEIADLGGDKTTQALYVPRPLAVRDLSLSALGGSLDHDTTFEPPAGALLEARDFTTFDALNIERWRHLVTLGRDMECEIVYKGFLFPLGLRVSLVKRTERQLFDFTKPDGKRIVSAYLIQRMFIRIGKPDKMFPAISQPHDGRAWPPGPVTMVTRQTPDLMDPTAENLEFEPGDAFYKEGQRGGRVLLRDATRGMLPGLVFWPCTGPRNNKSYATHILFQARFNNEGPAAAMPLLFVDNTAAHDPQTVEHLHRYYNEVVSKSHQDDWGTPGESFLATIDHKGVARHYAREVEGGETSYETNKWRLFSCGREYRPGFPGEGKPMETSGFSMSGEMEGADQPPFYPGLQWAEVRLKQVERIAGAAIGPATFSYDRDYIEHGMPDRPPPDQPSHVPADIFGRLRSSVALNFNTAKAGDRSGGIASPNTNIIALSRSKGAIGVNNISAKLSASAFAAPLSSASYELPPEELKRLADAKLGFEPAAMMGNARILGIIDLQKMILLAGETAIKSPVIREFMDYKEDVEETLQIAVTDVLARLKHEDIQKLLALYPDLHAAYLDLEANNDKPLLELLPAAKRFYEEAKRVAADPIRPILDRIREVIEPWLGNLFDQLRSHVIGQIGEIDPPNVIPAETLAYLKELLDGTIIDYGEDKAWLNTIRDRLPANRAPTPDEVNAALAGLGDVRAKLRARITAFAGRLQEAAEEAGLDWIKQECAQVLKDLALIVTLVDWTDLTFPVNIESKPEDDKDRKNKTETKDLAPPELLREIADSAQQAHDEIVAFARENGIQDAPWCKEVLAYLLQGRDMAKFAEREIRIDWDALKAAISGFRTSIDQAWTCEILFDRELAKKFFDAAKNVGVAAKALYGRTLRHTGFMFAHAERMPSHTHSDLAHAVSQILWRHIRNSARLEGSLAQAIWPNLQTAFQQEDGRLSELNRNIRNLAENYKAFLHAAQRVSDRIDNANEAIAKFKGARNECLEAIDDFASANSHEAHIKALKKLHAGIELVAPGFTPEAFLGEAFLERLTDIRRALILQVSSTVKKHYAEILKQVVAPVFATLLEIDAKIHDGRKVAVRAINSLYENYAEWLEYLKALQIAPPEHVECYFVVLASPPSGDEKCEHYVKRNRDDPFSGVQPDFLSQEITNLGLLRTLMEDYNPENPPKTKPIRDLVDQLGERFAAHRLGENVLALVARLLNGTLKQAIDLKTVRELLEQAILNCVPHHLTLKYECGIALPTFSENATIFGITERLPELPNDLDLEATTSINLFDLDEQPTFEASGSLNPFAVQIADVLSIGFKRASFKTINGGQPSFDIVFDKVVPGKAMEFLEALQQYLAPKPGGGFYLQVTDTPGIKAGYILDLGTIGFGALSFINVTIGAAIDMPFTGGEALIEASLGQPQSPIIISCFPYAGGGHLTLKSNAESIVEVDLSFVYGAGVAFSIGPVSAQGLVINGLRARKSQTSAELTGHFFAGGSGRLACFGFSGSFTVGLKHQSNGDMKGWAEYVYKFSVGFLEVTFTIHVSRTIAKGGSDRKLNFATRNDEKVTTNGQHAPDLDMDHYATAITKAVSPEVDWNAYSSYFSKI